MRAEVLAVGTELLLGQIVDTNSAWLGERLAAAGIDSHLQTKVGDNHAAIVSALRGALARADAVVVCGGLGPTHDDITREAIADVMGVDLVPDPGVLERIRAMFADRGRTMSANNARQAEVPVGATAIVQVRGTAPGLICPVDGKVVYAMPGVPGEMTEMAERAVIPDLVARAGPRSVIASRAVRTWGLAESKVAEMLAPRIEALDPGAAGRRAGVTIALLASSTEGVRVRLSVRASDLPAAYAVLDGEEAQVRALVGDHVFGVDPEMAHDPSGHDPSGNGGTMERAVGDLLIGRGLTLGLAESVTGGMVASRLVAVPGASEWLRGSVVAYAPAVKHSVLGVREGPVVSADTALAMAEGARSLLDAQIGLGITGVAGPTREEGVPVGTVFCGLVGPGSVSETVRLALSGGRGRIRQAAAMSVLDLLRRRLMSL